MEAKQVICISGPRDVPSSRSRSGGVMSGGVISGIIILLGC